MNLNKIALAVFMLASLASTAHAACKAGDSYTNQTVNCGGTVTVGLSCSSDSETQPAVFTLNNATLSNVTISAAGGSDGIHCTGGTCTLNNVKWLEVCEDAASVIADNAKMVVDGGSAINTNSDTKSLGGKPDKFFQINNANTSLTIKNFTATIAAGNLTARAGKLARSCGDCTTNLGPRSITVSTVSVKGQIGSIVGVNSQYKDKNSAIIAGRYDTATITGLKIEGYSLSSDGVKSTPPVCDEYEGVQKGYGSSTKLRQAWNSTSCKVSTSNVQKL